MSEDRLDQELNLLRSLFPDLLCDEQRKWVLLPGYRLPEGMEWNKEVMDICIEIKAGFPGVAPYGIYVPADLRYGNEEPKSWHASPGNKPSFSGNWGFLSWSPEQEWKAGADVISGSNLLNFVLSFSDRFKSGR